MLGKHLVYNICLFLGWQDIFSVRLVSKELKKYTEESGLWGALGKRDFSHFCSGEYEYFVHIPSLVRETTLQEKQGEKWCQKYTQLSRVNSNGIPDHIPKAYIRSICISLIREDNLRRLYNLYEKQKNMDWKITVNREIERVVQEGETDKTHLDMYIKQYFGQ